MNIENRLKRVSFGKHWVGGSVKLCYPIHPLAPGIELLSGDPTKDVCPSEPIAALGSCKVTDTPPS
jgi:hypothetical protein